MHAKHWAQALARGVSFLLAAVTNYHQLSGFNQHILTSLRFWKSQIINELHWLKSKPPKGCDPLGTLGQNPFPWFFFFPVPRICHILWVLPRSPQQSHYPDLCFSVSVFMSPPLPLTFLPPSFTLEGHLWSHVPPPQIIQDYLPLPRSFP